MTWVTTIPNDFSMMYPHRLTPHQRATSGAGYETTWSDVVGPVMTAMSCRRRFVTALMTTLIMPWRQPACVEFHHGAGHCARRDHWVDSGGAFTLGSDERPPKEPASLLNWDRSTPVKDLFVKADPYPGP